MWSVSPQTGSSPSGLVCDCWSDCLFCEHQTLFAATTSPKCFTCLDTICSVRASPGSPSAPICHMLPPTHVGPVWRGGKGKGRGGVLSFPVSRGNPSPPLLGAVPVSRSGCLSGFFWCVLCRGETNLADGGLVLLVLRLHQLGQEEGPLGQLRVLLEARLLLEQPHDVVVVLDPGGRKHGKRGSPCQYFHPVMDRIPPCGAKPPRHLQSVGDS